MLKDILLLCDGGEGLPAATAAAMALAKAHASNLTALSLHPRDSTHAAAGSHAEGSAAARARNYFEDIAAHQAGRDWRWADVFGAPADLIERSVEESRAHDVVMIDMPPGDAHPVFAHLPAEVMQRGGRPVILWPDDQTPAPIGRRVLVLWQGSAAAARALHESLPILQHASVIEIAGTSPAAGTHVGVLALSPLQHLRNHGVEAIPCARVFSPGHVEDLLEGASFDLVVLGANGGIAPAYTRFLDRRHTPLFLSC